MRFFRLPIRVFLVVVLILAAFASHAARFLVVDQPQKSDVILVLAGETNVRLARALDLLRQGVAPRVLLNAQANIQIYDQQLIGIAQKYVDTIGEASRVSVCPVYGLSTVAETADVRRCLQSVGAHHVLIVTSEFHTRRSLMILRHCLPQYEFSVTAAYDPVHFGESWWTNREWAKVTLDEWLKILWWELVDRWKQ